VNISLIQAEAIADAVFAHAEKIQTRSLALVILDSGGHPVLIKRQDGAGYLLPKIAQTKAYGALGMGQNTTFFAARAEENPVLFQSLAAASGDNIVFSPGGVIIRDASGNTIGALGVSGDSGPRDEECALAGIETSGLKALG
jgi:uncharacterized protein GlcG (DUF336 family)